MSVERPADREQGRLITVGGVQAAALAVGVLLTGVLYGSAVWSLLRLSVPVGILGLLAAAAVLGVCALNQRDLRGDPPGSKAWQRLLVMGALPVALYGAVYGCAGFRGCTHACGLIDRRLVPVLMLLAVVGAFWPKHGVLLVLTLASFGLLYPSCKCENVVNQPWIDLIGRSPECFSGPFGLGIMLVGAVMASRRLLVAGILGWLMAGGLLAVGIGHHHFDWPW